MVGSPPLPRLEAMIATICRRRTEARINFFDTANRYVPHAVVGFV
jgi:aryl-alcohol dehydrogenase-like predicted oxidoreductase